MEKHIKLEVYPQYMFCLFLELEVYVLPFSADRLEIIGMTNCDAYFPLGELYDI